MSEEEEKAAAKQAEPKKGQRGRKRRTEPIVVTKEDGTREEVSPQVYRRLRRCPRPPPTMFQKLLMRMLLRALGTVESHAWFWVGRHLIRSQRHGGWSLPVKLRPNLPPSVGQCVLTCRRVTNRLSARRMRQKRAEEREAIAHEVRCFAYGTVLGPPSPLTRLVWAPAMTWLAVLHIYDQTPYAL